MNRIKSLREEHEWKQKDLAEKLNVGEAAISKYENGKTPITAETIAKLCDIFDVSADYLLYRSDDRGNKKSPPAKEQQGDLLIQRALEKTGLLKNGRLTEQGAKVVSEFLASNAKILQQLAENDK